MNKIRFIIAALAAVLFFLVGNAQPGAEIEVKKPKKYENRKLPSEKTGEKKFTIPKKIYQNTVTHYNYYFNANNRLNDVIAAAKISFKEDYSQLLPFYNYSLDATAENKTELDSIIYKCTAGILLHDLRNSWIDNMYLLLAKAYLFRKDLDSAAFTLQYLNFAYAPKDEGKYDIPIGSNSSNDKGEFSIVTKEKNNIYTKLTSRPPSRNESFIWQIRNHIEKDELPEAAGVIEILRHDPHFPKRLQTDLDEAVAYWYYKQQAYDSAALHLSVALDNAANKQEKARWEYLTAQMYQLSEKHEKAVDFYNRCISHTTNPVMDIYARLNSIRIKRSNKTNYLQENIVALLKMAKRDKYENYRDIIYYAAAKIELERNNFDNAQNDLLKSVLYTSNNPLQRSQSFLLLGDLNYNRKFYPEAYNFYDSTDINVLESTEDKDRITLRKPPLQIIAENTLSIKKEDSLQALAKLPAAQRDAIIKKQAKALRSAQGIKEEEPGSSNPAVQKVPDLFAANNKSNDFYFYNAGTKSRGFSEFKARWGERPNVDNWRRKSAIDRQTENLSDVEDTSANPAGKEIQKASDNSYEGLMQNIPLTEEKLGESNKNIMGSLFTLGKTFISPLEEYSSAIKAYEELLRRFPNAPDKEEAWFNLIYAYQKTGDKSKSDAYRNQLLTNAGSSKWAKLIKNPAIAKNNAKESQATKKYEDIYKLFIEGKFRKAKDEKKIADSLYGNSYWTPQLLYIESIYYIKQQKDSTAIRVLTDLGNLYPDNPMAAKAKTMIDVLRRRKEIVQNLIKLNVTRKEDKETTPVDKPAVATTKPAEQADPANAVSSDSPTDVPSDSPTDVPSDSVTNTPSDSPTDVPSDSVTNVPSDSPTDVPSDPVTNTPSDSPTDVPSDSVTNTPSDSPTDVPSDSVTNTPSDSPTDVPSDSVTNAPADSVTNVPSDSPTDVPSDSVTNAPSDSPTDVPVDSATNVPADSPTDVPADSATNAPSDSPTDVPSDSAMVKEDTAIASPPVVVKNFSFVASDSQYVVVLLDQVDKVYASEAGNAFNRFNREKYYNQKINIDNLQLDNRFNLVLQGPFTNANAALDYIDKVRPVVKSRILPWLSADKYSFLVISNANLEVLKSDKDMDAYKQLLQKAFPGKF